PGREGGSRGVLEPVDEVPPPLEGNQLRGSASPHGEEEPQYVHAASAGGTGVGDAEGFAPCEVGEQAAQRASVSDRQNRRGNDVESSPVMIARAAILPIIVLICAALMAS